MVAEDDHQNFQTGLMKGNKFNSDGVDIRRSLEWEIITKNKSRDLTALVMHGGRSRGGLSSSCSRKDP